VGDARLLLKHTQRLDLASRVVALDLQRTVDRAENNSAPTFMNVQQRMNFLSTNLNNDFKTHFTLAPIVALSSSQLSRANTSFVLDPVAPDVNHVALVREYQACKLPMVAPIPRFISRPFLIGIGPEQEATVSQYLQFENGGKIVRGSTFVRTNIKMTGSGITSFRVRLLKPDNRSGATYGIGVVSLRPDVQVNPYFVLINFEEMNVYTMRIDPMANVPAGKTLVKPQDGDTVILYLDNNRRTLTVEIVGKKTYRDFWVNVNTTGFGDLYALGLVGSPNGLEMLN